jgi:hypothetical protein
VLLGYRWQDIVLKNVVHIFANKEYADLRLCSHETWAVLFALAGPLKGSVTGPFDTLQAILSYSKDLRIQAEDNCMDHKEPWKRRRHREEREGETIGHLLGRRTRGKK